MKPIKFKKIYIEITNICNLKCKFCLPLNREKKLMSVENFKMILSKVRHYTEYIYLHIKGEPLIHPELDSILNEAYQQGFKVNITTNGTLIGDVQEILLKAKALRQLNISMHAISEIDERKQELYLKDIIQLIKKIENSKVFLISLRFWMGNNQLKTNTIAYLEDQLQIKINNNQNQILPNVYLSYQDEFTWPANEIKISEFRGCRGIKEHIGILVDGTVVPCCLDGNGDINLGNIFEKSLEEILSSCRYQNMLKAFSTRKIDEELCKKCSYKDKFA